MTVTVNSSFLQNLDLKFTYKEGTHAITSMCSDPQSGTLLVGTSGQHLIHFELFANNQNMKVLTCKTTPYETMITSIQLLISNNGYNMYVAAQANGIVKVFTCSKAEQVAELQAHSRSINGLVCHSLKPLFATVSDDTIVNLWFCKFE